MREKYFNHGIIGNQKVTASFTDKGELIRLFYGAADYKQLLDTFHTGLKINDSALVYLHNDINNLYHQEYTKDVNMIQTEIINTYFNVQILQTDFILENENVLVRSYKITNRNTIDLHIHFLAYAKILTNLNNDTCGYIKDDCLIQYNHDFSVCTFSKQKLESYQINNVDDNFMSGTIGGKDYIGMSANSAISYDLKLIKPGEEVTLDLYIYVNNNKEKCVVNQLDNEINRIRKIDMKKAKEDTKKYWKKFLKDHDTLCLEKKDINGKIKKIYKRSILLFPMFINQETGGISAGIEVDEDKTKCGRYSYCWTRDAVFIAKALDIIGMKQETKKFYSEFCKKTQSKNGMWEQRFYTDGRLAPCWGYQVDETASVVYGVYEHYKRCKDKQFLKDNLKMCENAVVFLEKYMDDILKDTHKFQKSYDLWEEFEGISIYSVATIFAAFETMLKIYKAVKDSFENNRLKIEAIGKQTKILEQQLLEIKEYTLHTFYDKKEKTFIRNTVDRRIDVSIIGTVTPFKMFTPKEKNIQNTVEKINMTLRTYTGGYVRYENDKYMGGYNPWPIANLWMACYYLEAGDNKKALECFSFVTNSASEHGFLGEQVNNETMKPAWVIGLTWSHAMYIIVLEKLIKKGLL